MLRQRCHPSDDTSLITALERILRRPTARYFKPHEGSFPIFGLLNLDSHHSSVARLPIQYNFQWNNFSMNE